ncbi:MAG: L-alanine-DL-glutamate epimerase-like enolase superfamily enzyme [Polyangiales bacterium]|jgi:L-alanine-DL-glutamate epimerase-like enolase superfamily enzyme
MKVSFKRVRGKFSAQNALRTWTTREALIVELRDGQRVGRGEAAPLPGYSRETLDECERALRAGDVLPAAAEFAWHAAESELRGQVVPPAAFPLKLATLDPRAPGAAWKCKLGRDIDTEIATAETQRRPVRFDANGSLGSNAGEVLARLAAVGAEFIEEPVPFEQLRALHPSPVPVALDESLHGPDGVDRLREALRKGWAHVLVVKPMALGHAKARVLCAVAAEYGAPIIVSHLFDGPLAYAASALFAFRFATPSYAQGLGRHSALDAYAGYSTSLAANGMLEPWEGDTWPVNEGT